MAMQVPAKWHGTNVKVSEKESKRKSVFERQPGERKGALKSSPEF